MILMGICALLMAVGLNVRHALNDYGVKDSKLHIEAKARTTGNCRWRSERAHCDCGSWALCDSDGIGYECVCGDSKWYPD